MKKILVGVLVLFLNPVFALDINSNVEGTYNCHWTNPQSGNIVKGRMQIVKIGQTYKMNSKYDDNTAYIGTGIYNQSYRQFSLAFTNLKNPKETGIAIVELTPINVKSNWTWAYINEKKLEHTECNKQKV